MTKIVQLTDKLLLSPQIEPCDLRDLKAMGCSTIISNRVDGESPGQPTAAEMAKATAEIGIEFVHLPIGMKDTVTDEIAVDFDRAVANADGEVLAFCRTGTRCARIWAVTQVGRRSTNEILGMAGEAGYDLSSIRDQLSAMREAMAA